MATVTPKPLVKGVLLSDTAPDDPGLYKVPAGTVAVPRHILACNLDASDRTVTVYIVAAGESPSDQYIIMPPSAITTNGRFPLDEIHTMEAGDYITAKADAAAVVAFRVDGSEFVPS